jgi:hypothetical protein
VAELSPSKPRPEGQEPQPQPPTAQEAADFRPGEGRFRLRPLAQEQVRSLKILKEANIDFARALVRKAFARETRLNHVAMLKAVAKAVHDMEARNPGDFRLSMDVTEWLVDWMKQQGRTHNWKWTTQQSNMSTLQSALKYLQTYVAETPSWKLYEDVRWQLACRTARIRAHSERPEQALPATKEQVHKACLLAQRTHPEVAMLIALTWVSFGRTGSMIQLKREDVQLTPVEGDTEFKITIMRGKSNRLGQDPHTVTGKLGDFSTFVTPIVEAITDPKQFIIHAPSYSQRSTLLTAVRSMLRNANNEPRLENRSLRRGSLQTLARSGASIPVLLACSGHSSVKSLKRYLNFGRVRTEEQRAAGEIFGSLVRVSADEQPSS